ncbi:MAG: nucleotidyltransferase domain-containing protein [bacterium]
MIEKSKIDEIVKRIAIAYNPDKIILFGSYAWGSPNEDSDIDLLIIRDSEQPRHKRAGEIWKHLYGSLIPIDIIVYTNDEILREKVNKHSFIYSAINSGIVLYERTN